MKIHKEKFATRSNQERERNKSYYKLRNNKTGHVISVEKTRYIK